MNIKAKIRECMKELKLNHLSYSNNVKTNNDQNKFIPKKFPLDHIGLLHSVFSIPKNFWTSKLLDAKEEEASAPLCRQGNRRG